MSSSKKNSVHSRLPSGFPRRGFLQLMGCGAASLLAPGALAEKPARRKPNIIIILSDDQGYADAGFMGSKDLRTPNTDAIAAAGVRFTDAYVSCPVCSPTRAGLLTGRYQQRFGHEFNTGKPQRTLQQGIGLPLTEVTLADTLRAAGYATGAVGKWHLGMRPQFHPLKRGFDEFFGFLAGGHDYNNLHPLGINPLMRGTKPVPESDYLTDAFGREAVAFITRHQKRPFFLYLAFNAPHEPLQAPEKYLKRFEDISDQRRRTYAAMLSAMDDRIGDVLGAVRRAGLEQDTLVFFLSDNGGATGVSAASNGVMRSHKGTLYEGGIRVPFAMQWKGVLPAGTTHVQPISSLDIFSTAIAAAGASPPEGRTLDGVNLLPRLTAPGKEQPARGLFWRQGFRRAVRKGRWKLVYRGKGRPPELYDLAPDPGEQNDLAPEQREVTRDLLRDLARWDLTLTTPLWTNQRTQDRQEWDGPPRMRRRRRRM